MILGVNSQDLDTLQLNLGASFFREKGLPGSFNRETFIKTWKRLLEANFGALWVVKEGDKIVGAMGGTLYPDPNDGELVAQEMFWYIAEDHRNSIDAIRLFMHFEAWAKAMEAKRILMVALLNSPLKIDSFYKARGYTPVETHYVKIFT
jgi:hypothetical protein